VNDLTEVAAKLKIYLKQPNLISCGTYISSYYSPDNVMLTKWVPEYLKGGVDICQ
jgi:hypothetical protein